MPSAPFPDPEPDDPEPSGSGSRPVPAAGNDGAPQSPRPAEPSWSSDEEDSAAYLGELMAAAAAGEELTAGDISGAGFGQGGTAEQMHPGPVLATLVHAATTDEKILATLSDDDLIGVITAVRRIGSFAAWAEMTAIREYATRPDPRHPATAPDAAAGPAEDRPGEIDSAFMIQRPGVDAPATPLIFASPHSGRVYPAPMMAASQLDAAAIRGSEDAWVDRLIGEAPALGARLIVARLARVWLDVNREAFELDPGMFEDELPLYARARTARVAAGLGAIARVIRDGQEIYARKLSFAEARARIEAVHRPYHEALASLIAEATAAHGTGAGASRLVSSPFLRAPSSSSQR